MRGRKREPISDLDQHNFAELAASDASRREKRRYLAFWHIQQGKSFVSAAKEVHVDIRSLMRWVISFKKHGLAGLKDQPGRGKKPYLSKDKKEDFRRALLEMPKPVPAKDVVRVLHEKTGIDASLSTVYNILKKMQLSWITKQSSL